MAMSGAAQEIETSVAITTPISSPRSSAAQDGSTTAAPQFRAVVTPLAPEGYKLQVTLSRETHEKLRRAQALSRHTPAGGNIVAILDRALTLLVDISSGAGLPA